jgi:hypothetical protein
MSQPPVWTFLEFEADDDVAGPLAESLLAEGGWYADFGVGDDHAVVFAHKIFRYQHGRAAAMDYGRAMGVPEHQLDWPDCGHHRSRPNAAEDAASWNRKQLFRTRTATSRAPAFWRILP